MNINIHYGYARFNFNWTWLKDKQIILSKGSNQYVGMLIIADSDGKALRMYGYELISTTNNE
jgi:hypothetical protein